MNPLIVALDVPTLEEAAALAKRIGDASGAYKVGLELWNAVGPDAARSFDVPLFLDLKLHDIPNTVGRAVRSLRSIRPFMLNVHALGGRAMMEAAVANKPDGTTLLAVTILTSLSDADLFEIGLPPAAEAVVALASLAHDAGCDGVVCAPTDLPKVREVVPPPFVLVTPGIRPAGSAPDDQARTLGPAEAMRLGADYLVVGRPITGSADPRAAAAQIVDSLP